LFRENVVYIYIRDKLTTWRCSLMLLFQLGCHKQERERRQKIQSIWKRVMLVVNYHYHSIIYFSLHKCQKHFLFNIHFFYFIEWNSCGSHFTVLCGIIFKMWDSCEFHSLIKWVLKWPLERVYSYHPSPLFSKNYFFLKKS